MLRKAALVKRQLLSQRELVMVNTWKLDSSSAFVTSWGVGIVCCPGVWNQLSVLGGVALFSAGGPGAAVVRWGMSVLAPTALAMGVFLGGSTSSQLQCGWWFLKCSYRAGEFSSPRDSWGAGQLHRAGLSHHLATGKMHKCGAVPWSMEQ